MRKHVALFLLIALSLIGLGSTHASAIEVDRTAPGDALNNYVQWLYEHRNNNYSKAEKQDFRDKLQNRVNGAYTEVARQYNVEAAQERAVVEANRKDELDSAFLDFDSERQLIEDTYTDDQAFALENYNADKELALEFYNESVSEENKYFEQQIAQLKRSYQKLSAKLNKSVKQGKTKKAVAKKKLRQAKQQQTQEVQIIQEIHAETLVMFEEDYQAELAIADQTYQEELAAAKQTYDETMWAAAVVFKEACDEINGRYNDEWNSINGGLLQTVKTQNSKIESKHQRGKEIIGSMK